MIKSKGCRGDSAVSPVIGVLLMLVITIIIAAVVSGFAGGLAGNTKTAPSSAMEVKIDSSADDGMGGTTGKMTFSLLSGDSINTKDLNIITYYTFPNGTSLKHVQNQISDLFDGTRMPYLNNVAKVGYSSNSAAHFGNYTVQTGDVMSTGYWTGTGNLLGLDLSTATTRQNIGFDVGRQVDVKILHVPSNKYIYDKVVSVI